ncbi:DNA polymerase III subunit gamma/tau [Pseudaminobacter sp. 19-2017]|uniref:DNA polymerase III subunit gamma/tau n=1 Tax=Pseudaminobacter soli (ex Zhang et al. 2022) TaxID=2831468 RepID=A0A942I230_9HYPH|nr:DNA polymerase III subunit gamma/tau [Pseudaminobacter soli]MBS3648962.1 DNA polymerase III subunit gamma/tau [Pseudaminobacter soli]
MSEAGTEQTGKSGAYRVLARKYRPADFSSLIGQEPMVRTLTNAFSTGRIAQAWMLTGVRGVGKTTTARILARALNYKSDGVDQPSVDLTTPGQHCQPIMEGRHVDVIEMDAASHTGVDNMREILEQVRYAPVSARYKVYIIDEVHMLSGGAFNAMLKTLEEPPPHVKFIFATTEIRKVPITVLSRCQRFDLRRVDAETLVAHLAGIAAKEGVAVEDTALAMVARAAEGSVRDSLSIFDQAIAHSAGPVTAETVRGMLGLADRARVIDLFEHVMRGDMASALSEFRAQYDAGADPATVLTDLAEFTHFVTRLRYVPSAASDASLTEDERTRGSAFAEKLSIKVLSRAWQMLLKGIPEVQSSNRPVAAAEMVLIRMAHAASLPTLDEAMAMLEGVSSGREPSASSQPSPRTGQPALSSPASTAAAAPSFNPAPQPDPAPRMMAGSGGSVVMQAARPQEVAAPAIAAPQPAREAAPDGPAVRNLADLAALADANRDMSFKVLLKRCVRPVRIEPGRVEVALTPEAPKTLLNDMTTRLRAWTGRNWLVSLSREEGGPTLSEQEKARRESALLDASNDPAVAAILARFPGAKVIDVRIPDAIAMADGEGDADAEVAADPSDDDDN